MAAVLALLLIVPGSLIVMSLFLIAWTFLFILLHVIGELARPMRDHVRARAQRAEARRVDAVEVPLVLPERVAGLHAATDTLAPRPTSGLAPGDLWSVASVV